MFVVIVSVYTPVVLIVTTWIPSENRVLFIINDYSESEQNLALPMDQDIRRRKFKPDELSPDL